jgi:ankyrin repeat protein
LKTKNYDEENIFTQLELRITYNKNQTEVKIFQNLLNFFEQEDKNYIHQKKDSVWKEEPMVLAIKSHNIMFFCLLIFFGGKLGKVDFEHLLAKIENENEKFTKKTYLIKFLCKIRDEFDHTLLHHAAYKGQLECLKDLIDNTLNVNEKHLRRSRQLFFLPPKVHKPKMLIENNESVNVYNFQRHTPLHLAAFIGHKECIELLIMKGRDVNVKDIKDITPLHAVANNGQVDCLRVLLDNGADVNKKDSNEDTALHIAAKTGHTECLQLLIEKGHLTNVKAKYNCTSLHFAAMSGNNDCLEVLLDNGADANARSTNKSTPLHSAADAGHLECVKLLISNGADINAKNQSQETPLHYAAWLGKLIVWKFYWPMEQMSIQETTNKKHLFTSLDYLTKEVKQKRKDVLKC